MIAGREKKMEVQGKKHKKGLKRLYFGHKIEEKNLKGTTYTPAIKKEEVINSDLLCKTNIFLVLPILGS